MVECITKIHYNQVGLFSILEVNIKFLSEAYKLGLTAVLRAEAMLEWAKYVI